MFKEHVQRISLPKNISDWAQEVLKESKKETFKMQENKLNALKKQYERINSRLNRLYDAKFDGDLGEDIFKTKENEYNEQLLEIKSQIVKAESINPNFY